jgi:hypothetical protein
MRAVSGPALVIPIKATLGAKQRLSSRLGSEERRLLALAMAGDTLRVAGRAVQRSRCVVVAGDAEVARLAARHDMAVAPGRARRCAPGSRGRSSAATPRWSPSPPTAPCSTSTTCTP